MEDGPGNDQGDPRVAAVVLTHNAARSLERCLEALAVQTVPLTQVLVTDNASDEPVDPHAIRFANVVVQRLDTNLGPAGGYASALTTFLASGLEWAWVMDDDCVPEPDALETQLGMADPVRLVLPMVQWAETGQTVRSNGWWGALIHRSMIERVGVPNAELFWWTEDTEYLQWRIPNAGFGVTWTERPVVTVSRARDDDAKPAWKYYYEARNQVYHRLHVQRPSSRPVPRFLSVRVRSWRAAKAVGKLTARVLAREHAERGRKLTSIARGSLDGLRGRIGVTVIPDSAHRPSGPPSAQGSDRSSVEQWSR